MLWFLLKWLLIDQLELGKSKNTQSSFNIHLKCWNFKAVFQRNSAGIPDLNIWNHSGILMEFHLNTGGILPLILSKFTACFPELFRWNTTHFLAERTGILMGFLWYFDGIFVVFSRIWVVFWWNFSDILMEFQSKKQCERSYLRNLTDIFEEFLT